MGRAAGFSSSQVQLELGTLLFSSPQGTCFLAHRSPCHTCECKLPVLPRCTTFILAASPGDATPGRAENGEPVGKGNTGGTGAPGARGGRGGWARGRLAARALWSASTPAGPSAGAPGSRCLSPTRDDGACGHVGPCTCRGAQAGLSLKRLQAGRDRGVSEGRRTWPGQRKGPHRTPPDAPG